MEALTIKILIDKIKEVVNAHPDTRRGNNLIYQLRDAVLGAFAVFFMQSPSFLAQQQIMQEEQGRSNAQSLFALVNIPSDNQIRNLLDPLPVHLFHPVFRFCVEGLREALSWGNSLLPWMRPGIFPQAKFTAQTAW